MTSVKLLINAPGEVHRGEGVDRSSSTNYMYSIVTAGFPAPRHLTVGPNNRSY